MTDDGRKFSVGVEYSWKPPQCSKCSTFCHNESKCPKKTEHQAKGGSTSNPPMVKQRSIHGKHKSNDMVLPPPVEQCEWILVSHKIKNMRMSSEPLRIETAVTSHMQVDDTDPDIPLGFEGPPPPPPLQLTQTSMMATVNNSFSRLLEDEESEGVDEEIVVEKGQDNSMREMLCRN